jgi:hypothetical protein
LNGQWNLIQKHKGQVASLMDVVNEFQRTL